jgi:hypothetical protein
MFALLVCEDNAVGKIEVDRDNLRRLRTAPEWIKVVCSNRLKRFSAAYHTQQHDHNRYDQQDMNKAAESVGSYESE